MQSYVNIVNRGFVIPEELDIVLGFTYIRGGSGWSKQAPGSREKI